METLPQASQEPAGPAASGLTAVNTPFPASFGLPSCLPDTRSLSAHIRQMRLDALLPPDGVGPCPVCGAPRVEVVPRKGKHHVFICAKTIGIGFDGNSPENKAEIAHLDASRLRVSIIHADAMLLCEAVEKLAAAALRTDSKGNTAPPETPGSASKPRRVCDNCAFWKPDGEPGPSESRWGDCRNPAVVDGGNGTDAGVILSGNDLRTETNFGCVHHRNAGDDFSWIRLHTHGKEAWKDVPDTGAWVDALRGNPPGDDPSQASAKPENATGQETTGDARALQQRVEEHGPVPATGYDAVGRCLECGGLWPGHRIKCLADNARAGHYQQGLDRRRKLSKNPS